VEYSGDSHNEAIARKFLSREARGYAATTSGSLCLRRTRSCEFGMPPAASVGTGPFPYPLVPFEYLGGPFWHSGHGNVCRLHTLNDMHAGLVLRSTMPGYDLPETRSNLRTAIWILTLAAFVAIVGTAFYLLAL
jgi:hypothetical protein